MGCFGDMLDDLGPDGLFASPEERAEQRGILRAKEEMARRRHLAEAEHKPPPHAGCEQPQQAGRSFFGDMLDDLGPEGLFASPEERAQQRGLRQAEQELASREHQAQADPDASSGSQSQTDAPASLASTTDLLIVGLLVAGMTALLVSLP